MDIHPLKTIQKKFAFSLLSFNEKHRISNTLPLGGVWVFSRSANEIFLDVGKVTMFQGHFRDKECVQK